MFQINKSNTYLNGFNLYSKVTYEKLGRFKLVAWLLISFLAMVLQIVPSLLISFVIGAIIGVYAIVTGNISILEGQLYSNSAMMSWISLVLDTGSVILFFIFYTRVIEKRPFATIGLNQENKLKKYIKGALVAIGMQLFYFVAIIAFGWGEVVREPIYATSGIGTSAIPYVLLFLVGFMIQGASEEVVVRGWMMPVLCRYYKVPIAIIVSSLFFSFLHMGNPNVSDLALVNLALYGIFAALYAINDGGLWGIFAQHSVWNWFMGNVLGLPVSGMIIGNASIIETKLTGPDFITGGSFGPEGGILVTVIELIGIVYLCYSLRKKYSSD